MSIGGYNDYDWYNQLTKKGIFFVTRLKTNVQYRVINRQSVLDGEQKLDQRSNHQTDKHLHLLLQLSFNCASILEISA